MISFFDSSLLPAFLVLALNRFTLRRFSTIFFLSFDLNLVRFTGVILVGLNSFDKDNLLLLFDCTDFCITGLDTDCSPAESAESL